MASVSHTLRSAPLPIMGRKTVTDAAHALRSLGPSSNPPPAGKISCRNFKKLLESHPFFRSLPSDALRARKVSMPPLLTSGAVLRPPPQFKCGACGRVSPAQPHTVTWHGKDADLPGEAWSGKPEDDLPNRLEVRYTNGDCQHCQRKKRSVHRATAGAVPPAPAASPEEASVEDGGEPPSKRARSEGGAAGAQRSGHAAALAPNVLLVSGTCSPRNTRTTHPVSLPYCRANADYLGGAQHPCVRGCFPDDGGRSAGGRAKPHSSCSGGGGGHVQAAR